MLPNTYMFCRVVCAHICYVMGIYVTYYTYMFCRVVCAHICYVMGIYVTYYVYMLCRVDVSHTYRNVLRNGTGAGCRDGSFSCSLCLRSLRSVSKNNSMDSMLLKNCIPTSVKIVSNS